ncbi:MAG: G8 domain-containing protein, partial [Caulobacteraceae bacterium]
MGRQNRWFFFGLLVPLFFLGGPLGVAEAAQTSPAAKQQLWSSPATWPGRKVPRAGDMVSIERGKDVLLDVSPPALNGLHIEGKLSFSDKANVELTTEWIMLHGELAIGSEAKPHTRKATITLTD